VKQPVVVRARAGSRNMGDEARTSRDWVVATNIAFLPAIVLLWAYGWYGVAIHTSVVCFFSFAYHLSSEAAEFAWLDQTCATALFVHVLSFALEVGCSPVWVCTVVGLGFWRMGHKCHCKDRGRCGHPYLVVPAFCHGVMHLIAATGAVSLASTGSPPGPFPFAAAVWP